MEKVSSMSLISTHSLTRRLTNFHDMNLDWLIISTHSLTRRLTTTMGTGNMDLVQFQLTASQGG